MSNQTVERRDVLRAVGGLTAIGTIGSISGCSEVTDAVGGDGPSPVETVPEDSEYVFQANVAAFVGDDALRNGIDEELSSMREEMGSDELPGSTEDALEKIEEEIELDPRVVSNTIFSGTYTASADGEVEDAAYTIWAEWEEDDLVDAMEEEGNSFEEDTYEDKTIYVEENAIQKAAAIGVLEEGVFALGTEPYVEAVIDTYAGDEDAVDGDVREAYDSSEDGHVRYAFSVASSEVPDSEQSQYNTEVFKQVNYGYGSLHEDGDDRVATMKLETETEDAASDIGDIIQGGLTTYKTQISDDMGNSEELLAAIEATEADSEGTTMTVTHQRSAGDFAAVITPVLLMFILDTGSSMGDGGNREERSPQVSFSFRYERTDSGAGELTITHEAGDSVPTDQLYLRGAGFADASGVEQSEPGPWQGGASSDGRVAAGDRVTVGVTADYDIRVLWRSSSGDSSATLARAQGPDA